MNRVFMVGLALLVSLLILSSVVPRPSGLGRQEASPGWPAWRIVNEPSLIIPDWEKHLPGPDAVDETKAIVERIEQAPAVGTYNGFSGDQALLKIDEPYRVIYNAAEFETESFPKGFGPGTTGPDSITAFFDGIAQIRGQISGRENAIKDAADKLDSGFKEILETLDKAQRSLSTTADGESAASLESAQGYINDVRALAAKISSDIRLEQESLAETRSQFDLFYDNLCYRADLVGGDDSIARPAGPRRLPDSVVGNAIVLAVYAKEPWLQRCAADQLDLWQELYPEARVTLQWIKDNKVESPPAEFASVSPEQVEHAENETPPNSTSILYQEPRRDAERLFSAIFGRDPDPDDENVARLTQCVNAITAASGGRVTPQEIAAEAEQLLQVSVPGPNMLDAIEWLAQETSVAAAETTAQPDTSPQQDAKDRFQEIAKGVIRRAEEARERAEDEKDDVNRAAHWMYEQVFGYGQNKFKSQVVASMAAKIAEIRRYLPEATPTQIAQQATEIFSSGRQSNPNFTIEIALDLLLNQSANPQP